MDPFLGPVASALVAAVCAGTMLGFVRLSRISLEWWRRRGARAAAATAEPDEAPEIEDTYDAERVREARDRAFRDANFVLLAAAIAGAVGVAIALRIGFGEGAGAAAGAGVGAAAGASAAAGAGVGAAAATTRPGGIGPAIALAPLALIATVVAAFVLALADRGVTALARRLGFSSASTALDVDRWLEAARLLWPGGDAAAKRREPVGVGLAYVALFAACAAAWGALVESLTGLTQPPLLFLAPLLLVVPLAYASAAERAQRNALARLRQAAAGRQLLAAPAWGMAIVATLPVATAAGVPPTAAAAAWIALVLATPLALPGTALGSAWSSWPRGGDAEEPSVGVRALSAVAHYSWLGAIALAVGLRVAAQPGAQPVAIVVALGVAALVASTVLVLRTLAASGGDRVRRVVGAAALAAGVVALAARGAVGAGAP